MRLKGPAAHKKQHVQSCVAITETGIAEVPVSHGEASLVVAQHGIQAQGEIGVRGDFVHMMRQQASTDLWRHRDRPVWRRFDPPPILQACRTETRRPSFDEGTDATFTGVDFNDGTVQVRHMGGIRVQGQQGADEEEGGQAHASVHHVWVPCASGPFMIQTETNS